MAHELISVLSDAMLPMLEQLDLDRLVLPGDLGKKSFGSYPPDPNLPPSQRGEDLLNAKLPAYMAHARNAEWVYGFSGKAELAMDGRRYELSQGCLGVIPPRAMHLERILHSDQGYHLFWLCAYLDRNRITIHSSSYSGGNLFQLVSGAQIEKCPELCALVAQSVAEPQHKAFGWERIVRIKAVETIVRIIRHLKEHGLGHTNTAYQASMVDFAKAYINEHYSENLTLKGIAQQVFLSPNYFTSLFTVKAGISVFDYIRDIRLKAAGQLLADSNLPIAEVIHQVGFGNRSHFARSFKRHFGCTPGEHRRRTQAKA